MEFKDSGLPSHPAIEKAFETLQQFDKDDKYTTRGVLIAKLVATESVHKDPEAIAAGLLVPLAQDLGPFLCARADLPGRIPDILEGMFAFGKMSMAGAATDQLYKELDPAVRAVALASSTRMFEVTAEDLESTFAKNGGKAPKGDDAANIRAMLNPIKDFTDMVARNETEELSLVKKCQAAMQRIENCLDDAGIKLSPASKPHTPKP